MLEYNKKTTSKEVKEYLRNKGFYAIESVISNALKNIYSSVGAKRNFNGQYFVYEMEHIQLIEDDRSNVNEEEPSNFKINEIITDNLENNIIIKIYDKNGNMFNITVSTQEPENYNYKIIYDNNCIGYIYSNIPLRRNQYKYYSYVALRDKFNIKRYFDVNCRKYK